MRRKLQGLKPLLLVLVYFAAEGATHKKQHSAAKSRIAFERFSARLTQTRTQRRNPFLDVRPELLRHERIEILLHDGPGKDPGHGRVALAFICNDDGRRGIDRDLPSQRLILLNEGVELAGVAGRCAASIAGSLRQAACDQFLHALKVNWAQGCRDVLLHASIFRPFVLIVEEGGVDGFKSADASGGIGPTRGVH